MAPKHLRDGSPQGIANTKFCLLVATCQNCTCRLPCNAQDAHFFAAKLMTKSPRPKPARIPSFCVTSAVGTICAQTWEEHGPTSIRMGSSVKPGRCAPPPYSDGTSRRNEKNSELCTHLYRQAKKKLNLQDCHARPSRTCTTAIPGTQS